MSLALVLSVVFARYHATLVYAPGRVSFVTDKVSVGPLNEYRYDRSGKPLSNQEALPLVEPFLRKSGSPFSPQLLQAFFKIRDVPFAHPPSVAVGKGDVKAGVLFPADGERLLAMLRENGQVVTTPAKRKNIPAAWLGAENRLVVLPTPPADEKSVKIEYRISATDGNQIVGSFEDMADHELRAIGWDVGTGTYVMLHPSGARTSNAKAVDGGTIGGTVDDFAALWRGSQLKLLRRNAQVTDVRGEVQAGFTFRPLNARFDRAACWRGTPESYVDLHAYLPRDFKTSVASHIGEDGTIYGYGRDLQNRLLGLEWKLNPVRVLLEKEKHGK